MAWTRVAFQTPRPPVTGKTRSTGFALSSSAWVGLKKIWQGAAIAAALEVRAKRLASTLR